METIILLMISSVFLELLYFVYEDRLKPIFSFLYGIMTKDNYLRKIIADFFINIGPSISTVSVVGFFIPIEGVSIFMVVAILFLGFIITLFGAIYKKSISND